jgi:hypothetical protein
MRLASVRACSAVSLDAEAAELQLELPPVVGAPVQVERIRAARQHQQVKSRRSHRHGPAAVNRESAER